MNSLSNTIRYLVQIGWYSSLILITRKVFRTESKCFKKYRGQFTGDGVEIAGPSSIFKTNGYYPVYALARSLDNVNYSPQTRWHGEMDRGSQFIFNNEKTPGTQIINEAGALTDVKSRSYDFLISNHMLEHSANPIKVLCEWKRVVRDDGLLLIALPHKDGTFDHRRPLTTLKHLVEDHQRNTGEDDDTHIPEIMELHDRGRDYSNPTIEKLSKWMSNNKETRGAHHHVFNSLLAAQLMDYAGFEILDIEISLPSDIFMIVRNTPAGRKISNSQFLDGRSKYLQSSPFHSDKY